MLTDSAVSSKPRFWHLFILLAFAFCLGLYLICTTVLISEDGTGFISFAQSLRSDGLCAIKSNYQHPGYSFFIEKAQMLFSLAGFSQFWSWVYSAQAVSLACRLITVVILYFAGSMLVGNRAAFVGALILLLLPESAQTGADAMSEWPYLMFLSAGFLILLKWCDRPHWALMFLAGLFAGAGYLVRPECVQIVVFAAVLLACGFIIKDITTSKKVLLISLIVLVAGFLIPALPYMAAKGAFFPKKSLDLQIAATVTYFPLASLDAITLATKIFPAVLKFIERSSQVFAYFFWPFWIFGLYLFLADKTRKIHIRVLIAAVVLLNLAILTWLHIRYGYMGRRHLLSLVVMTIWFLPLALQWSAAKISSVKPVFLPNIVFSALIIIGIGFCLPKTLSPLGHEKKVYRNLASWLNSRTEPADAIMCEDSRISFYAQRPRIDSLWASATSVSYIASHYDVKLPKNYLNQLCLEMQGAKGKTFRITKVIKSPPKKHCDPNNTPIK